MKNHRAPMTILLAGASGAVGQCVLRRLLDNPHVAHVIAPVRRALPQHAAKLQGILSDMDSPEALAVLNAAITKAAPQIDGYVSCLGTTTKLAGSKPAFLAVDRDLVLHFAELSLALGARQGVLVSSVGASAQSGNFYLRVKGETERLMAALDFERLDILRPGLLLTTRQASRPAEALGQCLAPVFNPLLRGRWSRYRAIPADVVAASIENVLGSAEPGQFIHENREMLVLSAA